MRKIVSPLGHAVTAGGPQNDIDVEPAVGTPRVENVPGPYYVTDECISCGACWASAPDHFSSHTVHTYAYLAQQPENSKQLRLCEDARERCPVKAIGRRYRSSES